MNEGSTAAHFYMAHPSISHRHRCYTRWDEDLVHGLSGTARCCHTPRAHQVDIDQASHQSFHEIRQQINASDAGQLANSALVHYSASRLLGAADHMLIGSTTRRMVDKVAP